MQNPIVVQVHEAGRYSQKHIDDKRDALITRIDSWHSELEEHNTCVKRLVKRAQQDKLTGASGHPFIRRCGSGSSNGSSR